MPEEAKFTISILLRNIVLIIAVIIGLSLIGIDLSALAVLFGVLGIGIGFGLQSVVASFIAGFVLIFERPIKEGDRIQVEGVEGEVVHIRLRSTIINTLTNETIVVPNNKLIESNIHNYSHMDERIIIVNSVQVSYETDLLRAREVLQAVNEGNPYALTDPPPEVRVVEFQDSGILLELRTWIARAVEKYRAITWVNLEIWKGLKRAGITIPFPQRDVHIKDTQAVR
jgi:small-conductance mechanosensitive channel